MVLERLHDAFGIAADERRKDARTRSAELAEKAGQNVLSDGGRGAEDQGAGLRAAEGCDLLFGAGEDVACLLGVLEKDFAGGREADFGPGAIEELDAELFFEGFDLLADGGLGQVELFGGLTKTEMTRDGAKDDEAEVVEARHRLIKTFVGPISVCEYA